MFLLIPSALTGLQSSVHSCSPSTDFQLSSPREKSLRIVSEMIILFQNTFYYTRLGFARLQLIVEHSFLSYIVRSLDFYRILEYVHNKSKVYIQTHFLRQYRNDPTCSDHISDLEANFIQLYLIGLLIF